MAHIFYIQLVPTDYKTYIQNVITIYNTRIMG